jgi:hypothetical protein
MIGQFANGNTFGRVVEQFSCCDPLYEVFNDEGELRWVIQANCCQCGIMCNNRCGKCSEVLFTIHKPTNTIKTRKNCSGHVKKKFTGCLKEMFTDANSFELTFPEDASSEERFMLIAAVLMIDYRMYDDETNVKESIV